MDFLAILVESGLWYNSPMNFIDQFRKLKDSQPHLAMHVWKSENSDYCDQIDGCKNLYLCFNNRLSEDCMHAYDSRWNRDCCDVSYTNKCELCYEGVDLERCYSCDFSQDCEGCDECKFCYDLKGCKNCFGCVELRRKEFCIFNEEVGEKEYFNKIGGGGFLKSEFEKKFEELKLKTPRISLHSANAENCFGNYIVNSKNYYYVHKVHELEDCFYMYDCQEDKDCMDCCAFNKSELCYGCIENSTLYNCNFMYWCANCVDCEYLLYCFDCKNCFGCMDLMHKQYMILNEQYTKEEYFKKLGEIKDGMKKDGSLGGDLAEVL